MLIQTLVSYEIVGSSLARCRPSKFAFCRFLPSFLTIISHKLWCPNLYVHFFPVSIKIEQVVYTCTIAIILINTSVVLIRLTEESFYCLNSFFCLVFCKTIFLQLLECSSYILEDHCQLPMSDFIDAATAFDVVVVTVV